MRGAIAGADPAQFRLDLVVDTVTVCRLDQGEHDLSVAVHAPGEASFQSYDEFDRGTETFSIAATTSGSYAVAVRIAASGVRRAAYALTCEAPRARTVADDARLAAERLTTDARADFKRGDRPSLARADDAFSRARELWRDAGEPASALAATAALGDTLYRLGEPARATQAYEEVLQGSRARKDRRSEAEALTNLAASARAQANVGEALNRSTQALAVWTAIRFSYGEAAALTSRGVLLRDSGEYDRAQQDYARALAIFRRRGDRRAEAYALNNLAVVLENLGQRRQALGHLARAIPFFRETGDSRAEAVALVSRARMETELGDVDAATASNARALELQRALQDRLGEADAVEQLGRIYAASSQTARAVAEYERALALYDAAGSQRGQSTALHDIGAARVADGDTSDETVAFFDRALTLRRAIGLQSLEADTLVQLAHVHRLRRDFETARSYAQAATAIFERLHATVLERELRMSHSRVVQRAYAEYTEALIALNREQTDDRFAVEAFEVNERIRARSVVEMSRRSRGAGTARIDARLLARERALRQELNVWAWTLWQQADNVSSAAHAKAKAEVDRLLAAHAAVEIEMTRSDQRRAALLEPPVGRVDDLRGEVVDRQTLLVEYALGETRSLVWVVTIDGVTMTELPARAEIERRARQYCAVVGADPGASSAARMQASARAARSLSDVVLAPIVPQLNRPRVLMVADGALHDVPFAALPIAEADVLIDRHEIVTIPSAAALAYLRRASASRPPAPKLLAVLGDPVFDPHDRRVEDAGGAPQDAGEDPLIRPVSRLPFAGQEAERILALAPAGSEILRALDFDATRELAVSAALRDFRYLHFATHALRDDAHPELSGLLLAMVRPDGSRRDGFLRLHDIYNLRLASTLVVLSACETGVGRQVGGDGPSSLARGFLYAGSHAVLLSLWRVDDRATAAIMERFYRELFGGSHPSPAAALRAAQAAMRADPRFRHPFYWSGFAIEGQS